MQLERRLEEILGKRDAHAHLEGTIAARGTTVVVAEDVGEFLARDVVYGTYRNSGGFNQLEWIKARKLYNMPVEKAAEIGIVDEESAKEKKVLFLVSGKQGHREKPSVFRIKRGSARVVTQKELREECGYSVHGEREDGKRYWVWELEG